mgnify:CR=1 FL=1
MKIKVAVLDRNKDFMSRLSRAFQKKYEDKISLMLFSDEVSLLESLKNTRADLLLVDHSMEADIEKLAPGTVKGWLCEMPEVTEIDGVPAVCKYQNVENIYKSIVGIYAENSGNIVLKRNDSDTRIILFTSAQGGGGASSAAAAYALYSAEKGKKVFYLNLEKFGNADQYFSAEGTLSFSDVIYTLKSKNGNLALKLESVIQTDSSGTDFFHTCRNAFDMFELKDQEIERLISVISQVKKYDEIILDYSGDLTDRMIMLMQNCADKVVYISDGSMTGNGKFERFCEAVRVLEQRNNWNILGKMVLLYNRYSSKTGKQLERTTVPGGGGINRCEGITEREQKEKIANDEMISRI